MLLRLAGLAPAVLAFALLIGFFCGDFLAGFALEVLLVFAILMLDSFEFYFDADSGKIDLLISQTRFLTIVPLTGFWAA